ncbi:TCP-1/cpn60 chaperonin family protein [Halorussus salinisoli]|uniref:TCP-1/cpn60 chaperonin family protein n=1 Tax=Halorussus salinisoli TaxID=2558242 RepID=UPI0010C217B9|nr:TCP-1/cpn60 chaperonin family protein [Halorussus salinisoli]
MGAGEIENESDASAPVFPDANIVAVEAIADVLRKGLGPTPQDTLVVTQLETESGDEMRGVPGTDEFVVTSDGATILDELPLEHPVAPVVRRMVGPERPGDTDIEGEDIPDGVTSTVVLSAELLHEATSLLEDGLHPATIIQGYEHALESALETLEEWSRSLDEFSDSSAMAVGVARTAMTGNDVGGAKDSWAQLAVEAADQIGVPDEESFVVRQFSKGRIADSRLIRGAVLDRHQRAHTEMPGRKDDASVLLLDGQDGHGLQLDTPDEDVSIQMETAAESNDYVAWEQERRQEAVSHIQSLGVDVVVVQSGIDTEYQHLLATHDILGIRGVTSLDFRQVALATGATPVLKPTDATADHLGHAETVVEEQVEPRRHRRKTRRIIVFEGCPEPDSVVMMLRGVTGQIEDQATRQLRKATAAVAIARGYNKYDPGVVPGGGAIELEIARQVEQDARDLPDRSQLAVERFANAVKSVIATLIQNAGRDPIAGLSDLRGVHANGHARAGIVFPDGEVQDTIDAGVLDPVATKQRQFICATEVAGLLLKVDDAIDATFTDEPAGPEEAIYDEPARQQQRHLEREDGS